MNNATPTNVKPERPATVLPGLFAALCLVASLVPGGANGRSLGEPSRPTERGRAMGGGKAAKD